jgi:hypothetical protein
MVTKTGKFENIGENFLIFDMHLGSYISLENEYIQFSLFLNLTIILYSEIRPYSSKVSLIQIIPLFIQLTFAKHLPLNFIYLFPHVNCFPLSYIKTLQVKGILRLLENGNENWKMREYWRKLSHI